MTTNTFVELGLPDTLTRTLATMGYDTPTPIQSEAIPALLAGRDIVGQAQTGTGKTAAFALPTLAGIDTTVRKPQVLVLAPTRELANQVAHAFTQYASAVGGVRVATLCGGQPYRPQIDALRAGAQVFDASRPDTSSIPPTSPSKPRPAPLLACANACCRHPVWA